jgi:hypothetical protein
MSDWFYGDLGPPPETGEGDGSLDALYLVRRVRELAQVFGSALQFRDGFPGDALVDESQTPILPAINEYLFELAKTGYLTKYHDLVTAPGTAAYLAPASAFDITAVYYGGRPLRRTTRDALDKSDPSWRTAAGTPERYVSEGRKVTLVPVPIGTNTLQVHARSTPAPLAETTDTVEGMSDSCVMRVPYGAALIVATIDDQNPSHVARRQLYLAKAESLAEELSATLDKEDDAGAVSMDNWVAVPLQDSGRDKR